MSAILGAGKVVRTGEKMLGLTVLTGLALICAGSVEAQSKLAPSSVRREIPPGAQSVISATLGSADDAYRAKISASGYTTENPANRLSAQYAADGVDIRFQRAKLGLEFEGWGYGEHVDNAAKAAVAGRAKANRVEYQRGSLTEWYVNGPLGIEQGFTISQRPATLANSRGEALDIALRLRGNLSPSVDPGMHALTLRDQNGMGVLRYGPLLAYDASGHELRSWLEEQGSQLRLRVNTLGARYPVVVDPFVETAELSVTSVSGAPTYFGISTSVSDDGTVVVAGACGYDPNVATCTYPTSGQPPDDTATPYIGQAYVFVEPVGGWATATEPTAVLTAPDAAVGDGFGSVTAISGNGQTIVISAPTHSCLSELQCFGEAYVFVAPNGNEDDWATTSQAEILTPSDGASGDYFAQSIAIDYTGSTIAAREASAVGQYSWVNLYLKPTPGGWTAPGPATENAQLKPDDEASDSDNFGVGLAISKDSSTLVAGSFGQDSGSGEAYVFLEPPDGWATLPPPPTQTAETVKLLNSDGNGGSGFGYAAAVDSAGDTLVIGAPYQGGDEEFGEAYVFVEPAGGWGSGANPLTETTRLEPAANLLEFATFGSKISINDGGNVILVASGSAAAYQFSVAAGSPPPWPTGPIDDTPSSEFTPPGVTAPAGIAGLLSGNASTVFIPYSPNDSDAGAVFVYEMSSGSTETISATSGSGQTAAVGMQFSAPLVATVVNGSGTGVSGVTVTFTAPEGGASGTFTGGVNTAITDPSGMATSTVFTANSTAGSYTVTATAPSVTGTASFSLTNQAAAIGTTTTINSSTASFQTFPLPADDALVGVTPVTVNFTVQQASGSVSPTGSVVVTDSFGDTCKTTSLSSGTGMCTISAITQFGNGTTTLTATYTPSTNAFLGSSSNSFTESLVEILSPCTGAGTVTTKPSPIEQQTATTVCLGGNLSVVPSVAVVTDGVPDEPCSVSVTPTTPGAIEYTVTVTCTYTAPGAKGSLQNAPPRRGPVLLTVLEFIALLSILMAAGFTRQRRARLLLSSVGGLLCVFLLGGMASCNGPGRAPAGTYPVEIEITAGQFQLEVPVTVTVPK